MRVIREEEGRLIVEIGLLPMECPVCGRVWEVGKEWKECECSLVEYRIEEEKGEIDYRYEAYFYEYKGKRVECDVGRYVHVVLKDRKKSINVYVPASYKEKERGEITKLFEKFLREKDIGKYNRKMEGTKKRSSINYAALSFENKVKVLRLMKKFDIGKVFYNYVKEVVR